MITTGEVVDVYRVATKGQAFPGQQGWVTSFFILNSLNGVRYTPFPEGGQRKVRSIYLEAKHGT